jgi:replicative DNA helicase
VADEFVYDAATEAAVVAAAVADAASRKVLVRRLAADEFLVAKHATIWKALRALVDGGLEYEADVVRRLVRDVGGDDEVEDYLGEIEQDARVPDNLDWYVETMAWDATRARVLKGPVPELIKHLRDPRAEQADIVSSARAVARALEGGGRRYVRRQEEIYRSYRAETTARRVTRRTYPLGVPVVDARLTEGFAPGKTHLWAGLPGSGKSTAVFSWLIRLGQLGRPVLYAAWEMKSESIMDVGVSHLTGIPLRRIIHGDLDDAEAHRVDRVAAWISSRVRFMDNPFYDRHLKGKPSNERNLDLLEGYVAESGCSVVVYDLWARCLAFDSPGDVSRALYRMQAMHEEYGITGILLHHLNVKDVERRADRRPTRDAIKGSGAYVEVPDLIIGIHREGQHKAVEDRTLETICLKQRKGEANWAVRWAWDGATCRVSDPEEVPFDPGLEVVEEAGDIGRGVRDVKQIQSRKRNRMGRRD